MKEIKNKNMKWWLGIMSCVALFVVIGIFSYEKMCFVWYGVKIEATIEKDESTSLSIVKGVAAKAIHLTLNGREIFIDKEGNFREVISAQPGYSIVTLTAEDKFGKRAEKKFEIIKEIDAPAIAFDRSEIIN